MLGMSISTDVNLPADTLFLGMHRFRWLATAASTGGTFSSVEITARKGGEPPAHTHRREDQAFYVIDGHVTFMVGDEVIDGRPGSMVWAPRGVRHGFTILTDTVRMLEMSTPGGLEGAFLELSVDNPAGEVGPALAGPPPAEAVEALVNTFGRYEIDFALG